MLCPLDETSSSFFWTEKEKHVDDHAAGWLVLGGEYKIQEFPLSSQSYDYEVLLLVMAVVLLRVIGGEPQRHQQALLALMTPPGACPNVCP